MRERMRRYRAGDHANRLAVLADAAAVARLAQAVKDVERDHPLPRCQHGSALRDHAGERLEPPCGCRDDGR